MISVKALVALSTMGAGTAAMAGVVYLSTTPMALTSSDSGLSASIEVEPVRVLPPEPPTSVDVPTQIVLKPVLIQAVEKKPMRRRAAPAAAPTGEVRLLPCSGWGTMVTGPTGRTVRQLCAVRVPR